MAAVAAVAARCCAAHAAALLHMCTCKVISGFLLAGVSFEQAQRGNCSRRWSWTMEPRIFYSARAEHLRNLEQHPDVDVV